MLVVKARFDVFRDEALLWRWRFLDEHGRASGKSSQGYPVKMACLREVTAVKTSEKSPTRVIQGRTRSAGGRARSCRSERRWRPRLSLLAAVRPSEPPAPRAKPPRHPAALMRRR